MCSGYQQVVSRKITTEKRLNLCWWIKGRNIVPYPLFKVESDPFFFGEEKVRHHFFSFNTTTKWKR